MKNIHYLLIFLFPFLGNAQLTDTTCIKSRWIALKQSTENKDIFQLDASLDKSKDLVATIKRLVEANKLKIYSQDDGPNGIQQWNYIDYRFDLDQEAKKSSQTSKNSFFEINVFSDMPLSNMYGEDSVMMLKDGSIVVVYPEPMIYMVPTQGCDEIRIKEERTYNEKNKKYEYKPVGLSFFVKGNKNRKGSEIFWVDLNELFTALENKNQYSWYTAIVNKKYQGFQYMQTPCDEGFLRE